MNKHRKILLRKRLNNKNVEEEQNNRKSDYLNKSSENSSKNKTEESKLKREQNKQITSNWMLFRFIKTREEKFFRGEKHERIENVDKIRNH